MLETLRLVRKDALPEDSTYLDDGCEVAPHCLQCPLSKCRYDYPQGLRTLRSETAVVRAAQLRGQGYTVDAIAAVMSVSRRAVFRRLALARGLTGDAIQLKVKPDSGILVMIGEPSYGTA